MMNLGLISVFSLLKLCDFVVAAENGIFNNDEFSSKTFSFAASTGAINRITDPDTSAFFIVMIIGAYVAVQIFWITAFATQWDPSVTRPEEEFHPFRVFNELANPQNALMNIYVTFGTAAIQAAFFALPALFWPGGPLTVPSGRSFDDYSTAEYEDAEPRTSFLDNNRIANALRMNLCPNCVATTVTINTLLAVAAIIFWLITPAFRSAGAGKKKRKREADNPFKKETALARFITHSANYNKYDL